MQNIRRKLITTSTVMLALCIGFLANAEDKKKEITSLTVEEAYAEIAKLTEDAKVYKVEHDRLVKRFNELRNQRRVSKEAGEAFSSFSKTMRANENYKKYIAIQSLIKKYKQQAKNRSAKEAWPKLITKRDDGMLVINAPDVAPELNNPWTKAMEEAFIKRYNTSFEEHKNRGSTKLNTYFEMEKGTYGVLMARFLGEGNPSHVSILQTEDHQAQSHHRHTLGIDWYACFTIKGQVRKYFQFGEAMSPSYKKRMYDAAKIWTEKEPLRRKHYAFKPGTSGWGPESKNSWVDVRNTDNLKMMRDTSVYLMAEETGNTATAQLYKEKLRKSVVTMYRIGNGEWDSHNYFGHTTTPLHNLYDFAKDPEVKLLAKAALDWIYTATARKYWRGNYAGPSKRDKNAVRPMVSVPESAHIMFGENLLPSYRMKGEEVYVMASAYRAPVAVMNLAHRKFESPMTTYAAFPTYNAIIDGNWKRDPLNHETMYYGEAFQFGTLARGTQETDLNGFSILVYDSSTGAELIGMVPGESALHTGSPFYESGKLVGKSRVAHYENSAVYLNNVGDAPWSWRLPNKYTTEVKNGIMFIKSEKTWLAFLPINSTITGMDEKKTEILRYNFRRRNVRPSDKKKMPDWLKDAEIKKDANGKEYAIQKIKKNPDYYAASARGKGGAYSGIAVEIGEAGTHQSYENFVKQVLSKAKVDTSKIKDGQVIFTDSRGRTIDLTFGASLKETKYILNGKTRDYLSNWKKFGTPDGSNAPVYQDWQGGVLYVEAGGQAFACKVAEDGTVTFINGTPEEAKQLLKKN